MDTMDPARFIFAFVFVLGLIGLMAMLLKRYGNSLQSGAVPASLSKLFGRPALGLNSSAGRLEIIEVRYIDPRRKLVLVRRDKAEHLLLLADGRETVIESIEKNSER